MKGETETRHTDYTEILLMLVRRFRFKFWYFGIYLVFGKFQIVTTYKTEIKGKIPKQLENERERKHNSFHRGQERKINDKRNKDGRPNITVII